MGTNEKKEPPFICDPCRQDNHDLCPRNYRRNGILFKFKPCLDSCEGSETARQMRFIEP